MTEKVEWSDIEFAEHQRNIAMNAGDLLDSVKWQQEVDRLTELKRTQSGGSQKPEV